MFRYLLIILICYSFFKCNSTPEKKGFNFQDYEYSTSPKKGFNFQDYEYSRHNELLNKYIITLDRNRIIEIVSIDSTNRMLELFIQTEDASISIELDKAQIEQSGQYHIFSCVDNYQIQSFLLLQNNKNLDEVWLFKYKGAIDNWKVFTFEDMIIIWGEGNVYTVCGGFVKGNSNLLFYNIHSVVLENKEYTCDRNEIVQYMRKNLRQNLLQKTFEQKNNYCNEPLNISQVSSLQRRKE